MTKTSLVSFSLLFLLSGKAFAHKIFYSECDDSSKTEEAILGSSGGDSRFSTKPSDFAPTLGPTGIFGRTTPGGASDDQEPEKCYSDDPDAVNLRGAHPGAAESDRTAALAFCRVGGYDNVGDCADDVLSRGLADSARSCLDKAVKIADRDIELRGHKFGGGSSGGQGIWHTDYRYSKEEGMHRHDWSPEAREQAGVLYASMMIEKAKQNSAIESKSTSSATAVKGGGTFGGEISGGLPGVGSAKVTAGTSAEGGNTTTSTTTSGPLDAETIKKLNDKYKKIGEAKPDRAGVDPDIVCIQSEPTCSSSSATIIKNTSYSPNSSGKGSADSSSGNGKNNNPAPSGKTGDASSPHTPSYRDDNTSPTTPIPITDGGSWAGEPTPARPGEVWADFTSAAESNPLAECMYQELQEKIEAESNKSYDGQ